MQCTWTSCTTLTLQSPLIVTSAPRDSRFTFKKLRHESSVSRDEGLKFEIPPPRCPQGKHVKRKILHFHLLLEPLHEWIFHHSFSLPKLKKQNARKLSNIRARLVKDEHLKFLVIQLKERKLSFLGLHCQVKPSIWPHINGVSSRLKVQIPYQKGE